MSGARRGEAAIAHYDALLRDESFAREVEPDVILRVGDLPVSKPLRGWLAGCSSASQIALDLEDAWQDPAAALAHSLRLDPVHALSRLAAEHAPAAPAPADPDWLAQWRSADERAAEAILGVLAEAGLSEPAVAAELGVLLPEQATVFVASSMPVRDVETFWPVRPDPPRVLCNRGASGIDGTVSSAFGALAAAAVPGTSAAPRDPEAAVPPSQPVVLLIGDVALAHDIGGLLAASRHHLALTIVLLDNGGGGIFDFLPVAGAPMALAPAVGDRDLYTQHVATPTGLDFAGAAGLYGLAYAPAGDVAGFRSALEQALAARDTTLIHVRGERDANVALHRQVWGAVARALSR
jgi:2-succinyl-5-enolpyruvyl-6-hydroxy-3-cyclohexene-1-carboxylate synthase